MSEQSASASLPSLSVVLPSYNVDRYLEKCVASLLAEAPEHLELIVVDDGSTDDTPAIADALAAADARIRVIHQANAGCPAARNAGFAIATGDYMGFVDPDDEVEPGWARHLLEAAAIRQPAAIVKGEHITVGLDGTCSGLSGMCMSMLVNGPLQWYGAMWSAIYRRDFLQRHGMRFPEHYFDDVDFQAKALLSAMLAHEPITISPQAIYRYLRREGSLDANVYNARQMSGILTTITELHEILKMHAQQLPPFGVALQYWYNIGKLLFVARRAERREDQIRAWALAGRMGSECPFQAELKRIMEGLKAQRLRDAEQS